MVIRVADVSPGAELLGLEPGLDLPGGGAHVNVDVRGLENVQLCLFKKKHHVMIMKIVSGKPCVSPACNSLERVLAHQP